MHNYVLNPSTWVAWTVRDLLSKGCIGYINTLHYSFSSLIESQSCYLSQPPTPRHVLCLAVGISAIKNANWEWQSNREFHHEEIEWNSLVKRGSTKSDWTFLVSVALCYLVCVFGDGYHLYNSGQSANPHQSWFYQNIGNICIYWYMHIHLHRPLTNLKPISHYTSDPDDPCAFIIANALA